MTMPGTRVENCVDILCDQGCRVVLEVIEALQTGREMQAFADLDADERVALCRELQAIMAVYENRCRL